MASSQRTVAWLRYVPASGNQWHLNYDARNKQGQRAWRWYFTSFNTAIAYAVQHASEILRASADLN